MQKRTVATVRELIETVNKVTPLTEEKANVAFRKVEANGYVIYFETKDTCKHVGPMTCGEACEFLNGVIYAREEAKLDVDTENLKKQNRELRNKNAALEMERIKWGLQAQAKASPTPIPPHGYDYTYQDMINAGWTDTQLLTHDNGKYADLVPISWKAINVLINEKLK